MVRKKAVDKKFAKFPHFTIIIMKMCEIAGVDFYKMGFDVKGWYTKHTWTKQQEYTFVLWLELYLTKHKEARMEVMQHPTSDKKVISKFAKWFKFNYGWKIK